VQPRVKIRQNGSHEVRATVQVTNFELGFDSIPPLFIVDVHVHWPACKHVLVVVAVALSKSFSMGRGCHVRQGGNVC